MNNLREQPNFIWRIKTIGTRTSSIIKRVRSSVCLN
jgi:hypothetical protein